MMNELPNKLFETVVRIRRTIHEHPELSNQEHRTSAFVKEELLSHGISNIITLGSTSFAVEIQGQQSGPSRKIAVRADLDALPIEEKTGHEFSSKSPGVMHACGHDGHTAMVAGLAIWVNDIRESFSGSIRCIFQQAEEAEPLGGPIVVKSGILDDVDGVLGIHVDPGISAGQMTVREGAFAASGDEFKITVKGRSCHAAKPHEGVDAIAIAASMIQEIQKICSRFKDPQTPLVVTVSKISGGVVTNIICDRVEIEGTIRSLSEQARQSAHSQLEKICTSLARMYGGDAIVEIFSGEPVLMNDERMVELIRSAARRVVGTENVLNLPPWAASDDFAYYGQVKPSAYFRLGVGNQQKNCVHGLHHSEFKLDEDALPVGIRILKEAAFEFLGSTY